MYILQEINNECNCQNVMTIKDHPSTTCMSAKHWIAPNDSL